ncbi:MAG: hypothetical protein CMH56_07185 [Myxococcales bacterium]|nr:hypothetical protein [Myxococcales bacterium]
MTCGLTRSRTIRYIRTEGLPPSFLETDFRKRIFLKEGELIDQQEVSGRNRITRQRQRLEKYLESQGYFGSKVQVLTPPVPGSHAVDILVRITGGHFVSVRFVYQRGDSTPFPFDDTFKKMCASVDMALETVGPQSISCFIPKLFKKVVKKTETKIRQLGYKRARLKGEYIPVTGKMAKPGDNVCKMRSDDKPDDMRCVDLKLKLKLGPHEKVSIQSYPKSASPSIDVDVFKSLYSSLTTGHAWLQQIFSPQVAVTAPLDTAALQDALETNEDFAKQSMKNDELKALVLDAVQKQQFPDAKIQVKKRKRKKIAEQKVKIRSGKGFRIKSVRFKGNDAYSDAMLLNEILIGSKPFHFFAPGALVQSYLAADVARLQEHYRLAGHAKANIQTRISSDEHQNIEVVFHIEEGVAQKIKHVYIHHGVDKLKDRALDVFDLCVVPNPPHHKNETTMGPFCSGTPYLAENVEAQRQKLVSMYVQEGYTYAHVSMEQTEDQGHVEVHYTIDPDTSFETQKSMEAFKRNVPPVLLGEILFDGNMRTQTSVLRREMGITDNYRNIPLSPLVLSDGVDRLRKTGLFSKVQLKYLGLEEEWRRVHAQIFVEEKSYFSLDTSLSFSTDTFFSWQTKFRHRNLLGAMLDYEALVDNGLFWGRVSQIRSTLKWPHILGTPLNFSVVAPELLYEDRPQPISLDSQAAALRQRVFQTRMTAGLDWVLSNLDTISLGYELRWAWWDSSGRAISLLRDANEAINTMDGLLTVTESTPIQEGLLRPAYRSMKLDNPFNPKEGHQMEFSVGLSHPSLGSAAPFAAFTANLSRVKTFGPLTTAFRLLSKLSFIDNPQSNWYFLRNEISTLGGDRTIRGYGDRTIGVFGVLKDQKGENLVDEETQMEQVGVHNGNLSHLLNAELRFPLLGDTANDSLQGAFFSDFGLVTVADNPLAFSAISNAIDNQDDPNQFGLSVGAGLRYILPVGPIAADFAVSPLHQQLTGGPLWRIHLQFGFPF